MDDMDRMEKNSVEIFFVHLVHLVHQSPLQLTTPIIVISPRLALCESSEDVNRNIQKEINP